jgi:hypothetical protein
VPAFVSILLDKIATKRDLEGIYRKSGLQTNMDAIIDFLDGTTDAAAATEFVEAQAGHDVACVLKQYIRTLAAPVVPQALAAHFTDALALPNARHTVHFLKLALCALPTPHYEFLKAFCEHLAYVEAGDNQMTFGSFALVLGGNFFRTTAGGDVIREMTLYQEVFHLVFTHWRYLFFNEPLVMADRYATLKVDVKLPKAVVRAGERLRVIEPVGDDSVRLEYSGQPTVVANADVEMVPDDDVPPAFWNLIGEQRSEFLSPRLLDPDEMELEDAARIEAQIEEDLAEIAKVNKMLVKVAKNKALKKSEKEALAIQGLSRLQLF